MVSLCSLVRRAVATVGFGALITVPLAAHAQTTSPYASVTKLGTAQARGKSGVAHFGHLLAVPGEATHPEHVREVDGHANAVAFFFDASAPSRHASLIASLDNKVSGMVFVNEVFMSPDGSLRPTATVDENLAALKAQLGVKLDSGAIPYLAFDEPMWRRQSGLCASRGGSPAAIADCRDNGPRPEVVAEMRPALEGWIDKLRGITAHKLSVVVIEAHPMVRDALELPVNADVYGFDCYEAFDRCSWDRKTPDVTYSNRQLWSSIKARVQRFNKDFGGHRRMALTVPTTRGLSRLAVRNDSGLTGSAALALDRRLAAPTQRPDEEVAALAKRHLDEFATDPMTVVIGTFLWNTVEDGDGVWLGARGLPATRALLEKTGRRLLGRTKVTTERAPIVEFRAQAGAVPKRSGSIWSWTSTYATSCRSLTEPTLPPMAPNGALYRVPDAEATTLRYAIECVGPGGKTTATTTYSSSTSPRSTRPVCRAGSALCR
ncbi:MAG: hypothetical protein U0235_27420 [Polyangiaceae bacterium]